MPTRSKIYFKLSFAFAFALLVSVLARADMNVEIDSLQKVLSGIKTDNLDKLALLNKLTWEYRFTDTLGPARIMADSTLKLCDKLLAERPPDSTRKKILQLKADTYVEKGYTFEHSGERFSNYENAHRIYQDIKDTAGLCDILNTEQYFFSQIGDNKRAVDAGTTRVELAARYNDLYLYTALGDVAALYEDIGDYPAALRASTRKLHTHITPKPSDFIEMAGLFAKTANCDSAQLYLALADSVGAIADTSATKDYNFNYRSIYQTYIACHETDKAINELYAGLKESSAIKSHVFGAYFSRLLAENYLGLSKTDSALKYALQAKNMLDSIKTTAVEIVKVSNGVWSFYIDWKEEVMPVYRLLADVYKNKKDYAASLLYENLYRDTNDSLAAIKAEKVKTQFRKQWELSQSLEQTEQEKQQVVTQLKIQTYIRYFITALLLVMGLFGAVVLVQKNRITREQKKSEELLLNILPGEVAEELKEKGSAEAKLFDNVIVLFTDFKDFTKYSEVLSPQELVTELHECFKRFDEIAGKYGIEKIKTVGDAYLAVSGLPVANPNHAMVMVKAALEIRDFMVERKKHLGPKAFEVRIGIHSGRVVAGIVGVKKFAYDIWGDTVNTAARMEQNSEPGKINISESTWQLVKDNFNCTYRGEVAAKNKGQLKMYFVEGV